MSVLLTEWYRRLRAGIPELVITKLRGVPVWCNCLLIPRQGGKRGDGSERWRHVAMQPTDVESRRSRAATARKRIERVLTLAGAYQLGARPGDLRKYYATIFHEAWVRVGDSKWEGLRRRMRHSSVAVTKKYYVQRRLAEEIMSRWALAGGDVLADAPSEVLLGM